MKKLLLLEVSALLNVKVEGTDFWVWSNGVVSISIGGGSGGGVGGIVDEPNTGDAGADFWSGEDDFNRGSIGADFNTENVGTDFDVDNFGADSDMGSSAEVDFDADSSDDRAGDEAGSSDVTFSTMSRGGECTSTMLCCILNFPFDREILSTDEVLDLLLSLMVPLYALMSVNQFCIN